MDEVRSKRPSSWLFLAAAAFMLMGTAGNPLFFACAIFFLAAAAYQRDKLIGIIGAAAGLAFLLLVLGYGLGKDAALRDNARSAAERPAHLP